MAQRAAEAGITVPLSFLDGADVDAVRRLSVPATHLSSCCPVPHVKDMPASSLSLPAPGPAACVATALGADCKGLLLTRPPRPHCNTLACAEGPGIANGR